MNVFPITTHSRNFETEMRAASERKKKENWIFVITFLFSIDERHEFTDFWVVVVASKHTTIRCFYLSLSIPFSDKLS